MRILISNDDGVHARGIQVLFQTFKKLGEVTVVAPLDEKSTTGHSLTLHKPLRLIEMDKNFYGASGSPADCVYLGTREVMKTPPDLVISGINRGANLGQDVYYSGTLSAAREACILGIPSIAVSQVVDFAVSKPEAEIHYQTAADLALKLVKKLFLESKVPKHTFYNLNVPDLPMEKVNGIRILRQGFRYYSGTILKRKDHRGKDYFWVGGQYEGFEKEEGTDCFGVDQSYASLTPLKLDCTDYHTLERLSKAGLEGGSV